MPERQRALGAAQAADAERRDDARVRTLIAASIVYNNGQSTLGCVIRNLSETGAKLSASSGVALPDRFDLAIPQRNRTYRAYIAWRRGDEIGVRFDEAATDSGAPEAALRRRIRELEAEVARLKDRVAQLTQG